MRSTVTNVAKIAIPNAASRSYDSTSKNQKNVL